MGEVGLQLGHDHGEINRVVLALSTSLTSQPLHSTSSLLLTSLVGLQELLFRHFAREEGLFAFVAEIDPKLELQIEIMEQAHDRMCAAVARTVQLALDDAPNDAVAYVFQRFEAEYVQHAAMESVVLDSVDGQLDEAQRERLASILTAL